MIDSKIKTLFGFDLDKPDVEVLAGFKLAATRVCKPCWELKYCPYGPWVEDSPLLPLTLNEAMEHQESVDVKSDSVNRYAWLNSLCK